MARKALEQPGRTAADRPGWLAALAERVREGRYVVDPGRVALAMVRAARGSLIDASPPAPRRGEHGA